MGLVTRQSKKLDDLFAKLATEPKERKKKADKEKADRPKK